MRAAAPHVLSAVPLRAAERPLLSVLPSRAAAPPLLSVFDHYERIRQAAGARRRGGFGLRGVLGVAFRHPSLHETQILQAERSFAAFVQSGVRQSGRKEGVDDGFLADPTFYAMGRHSRHAVSPVRACSQNRARYRCTAPAPAPGRAARAARARPRRPQLRNDRRPAT